MRIPVILLACIAIASGAVLKKSGETLEEEEARAEQRLREINEELDRKKNINTVASWAYASNITESNLKNMNDISVETAKYYKELAAELKGFNTKDYKNEDLKRQIKKLSKLGYSSLSSEKYKELLEAITSMESNYAKVKLCSYTDPNKCDLALEPEITEILISSRDPEELKYYWKQWYDKAGTPTRESFNRYIELNREAAQLDGYNSGAESWLDEYEDETFEAQLENIFNQIRPLYEQLHAYVRFKLGEKYGRDIVPEKGPIPMHVLGNMWGQTWSEIAQILVPYPDKKLLDVTDEMVKQGYTPVSMFQKGDEFFQSLNMTKLPQSFWDNSILEKPKDGREMVCHASAWDFYVKDDVRIKQCTRVTMDQFFTAHHELGHIQYYLQYQHQPSVYREGANPGFHEAVGDVLSLSVSTPKHLEKVGLLKDFKFDEEAQINQLLNLALDKMAFLPFAYTIDKYRWGVFRGEIQPSDYNCKFWELRAQYGGIEPPVTRSEDDFDPPAKYHISADVEYLRYLVSFIIQFQFHQAACEKAGQFVPNDPEKTLLNCDIYQSAEAGNAFKEMLQLGSSKPWPDAMQVLTGQRKMDAGALIEYFRPLSQWLEKKNKELGAYIGWEKSTKCVKK
ncbi:angiotensin-converting enzyme-like isoform X2 [Phlebotomus papatasi]|uniref:angiotensin-converting enzyme-like isoform X2 n=1 Tax=Phlebotomus papatasi TaxID=29031 RepID=UPI0024841010|nr:angiotensin-converting enzyme-like isoform X2 [Phlebotomus papatasi]